MPDKRDMAASPAGFAPPAKIVQAVEQTAREPWLEGCTRFFRDEKKWITDQHIEVCRVPAATFQEQVRAEYLRSLFRDVGYGAQIDDAGNVIAPIIFDKKQPYVAVTAHMDTVIAPRGRGDVSVQPDGTIDGPGVTDNGAGLAALIALARALRENPPRRKPARNILLVANVAEEGEGNLHGMKYLCHHSPLASRINAFLVLDGASIGHITAEALGSRRFEITIEGPGGHSWNDYGTANPIHALSRTVAELSELELPSFPRTTLNVGVIEGGCVVNSIALIARAKVDIRSRRNSAIQQVVGALEDAVRKGVESENRRSTIRLSGYKIREIGHRPAAGASTENPVLACVEGVDTYLGIRSRLDCASTDANVPLSLGVPAVAIGAGGRGGGAHTPSEWYHPEGRETGLQRIALALGTLIATEE